MGSLDALINPTSPDSGSLAALTGSQVGAPGSWFAANDKAVIDVEGSLVTLADGRTQLPALFISDEKQVQKYVMPDGEMLSRGKVVAVFVFSGEAFGKIGAGDVLTASWDNSRWVCETPFATNMSGGVCSSLAVACYPP